MPRRKIPPSEERLLIRKIGLFPSELSRQEEFPERITLMTDIRPTLTTLQGFFGQSTKLVDASQFNELLVAQGGSGLNNLTQQNGSTPATYDGTNQITRAEGFKRFDVLVRTQAAQLEITLMDGTTITPIILDPGRYSFDLNTTQVRIQDDGTTGGTHQLVGYYTDPSIKLP